MSDGAIEIGVEGGKVVLRFAWDGAPEPITMSKQTAWVIGDALIAAADEVAE